MLRSKLLTFHPEGQKFANIRGSHHEIAIHILKVKSWRGGPLIEGGKNEAEISRIHAPITIDVARYGRWRS